MTEPDFLRLTVMSALMFSLGAFGFVAGLFPGGVRWHLRLITGRWGYILSFMYVLANAPMVLVGFIITLMPESPAAAWLLAPLTWIDGVAPYALIGLYWGILVVIVHVLSLMVPDTTRDERKPLHELDHDDLKEM